MNKISLQLTIKSESILCIINNKEYVFNHKFLRNHCPCASCINEITGEKMLDPTTIPETIQAIDYIVVGNYAIQFLWDDAHYTGIYTYEYLEKLGTKTQNA
tara:strand:+ start:1199 stop:1501 length:303 start_codon:yes stop_codon:yes gene_type:complete